MHAVYAWHVASASHFVLTEARHALAVPFEAALSQAEHWASKPFGGLAHTVALHAVAHTLGLQMHAAISWSSRSLPPGSFVSQHFLHAVPVLELEHGPGAGLPPLPPVPPPPVPLVPLAPDVPPVPAAGAPPLPAVLVLPPHATATALATQSTAVAARTPKRMRTA